MVETTYTQSAGMDSATTTDNVTTAFVRKANNGSDFADKAAVAVNLDLEIGVDVQAYATVLANTTASYTTAEAGKLSGIATGADVTDATSVIAALTAGSNITIAGDGTISATDTNTTYSVGDGGLTQINFTSADNTKLDGIETLADVTDSTNVTAAGALMDSELASVADVKALDQSVVSGATPTLGIANMTLDDTSLTVSDTTNLQTFAEGVDSALLRARGTGFTTTYVSTVSVGGTTFAQPAVSGEIHSDQGYFAISYAGATGITVATLSSPSTYVYVDNAGNLQQQTSTPTRQDWSRKMFTMRIAMDTSAETIIDFEYLNNPIGHYANSIRDIYQALVAQGVPFKGGQVITGRAGDLGFDVGAGTITEFGGTGDIDNANVLSRDAVANAEYTLIERTGAGTAGQTNLVKSWDNAGSITVSGSGTFVGHRLYRFSNGNFAMQYGQGNYANLVLARAGILLEEYVLNERLLNATFFGWWIIGETATNTGGTTLTEFREYTIGVQGGSSSSFAGCLLQGNNLSDLLDVSAAQVNLDLEPGVDVQAYAAVLANTTASYTTAEATKIAETIPASLGTAAQVLTVNAGATAAEWAAAGGGGGAWSLISSATVTTAVSSVDFTSLTGYDHYCVVASQVAHATSGTDLCLQTLSSGTPDTSSFRYELFAGDNGAWVSDKSTSASFVKIIKNVYNAASLPSAAVVNISSVNDAAHTNIYGTSSGFYSASGRYGPQIFGGSNYTDGVRNGVRLLSSSGNITSGTFSVYGVS
jgi:hypothetical protein